MLFIGDIRMIFELFVSVIWFDLWLNCWNVMCIWNLFMGLKGLWLILVVGFLVILGENVFFNLILN